MRDQIIAHTVEHPTEGPRSIALQLANARFGGWRVARSTVYNVLKAAGMHRRSMRLAAAEALAASEGGPITERVLRDLRAAAAGPSADAHRLRRGRPGRVAGHPCTSANLKGVGRVWQYTKDLIAAIEIFIDSWNERCAPFVWTKTADQIIPHATKGHELQ